MTALVVGVYVGLVWLILWAIRNMRRDSRAARESSSWLANHERDNARRRWQREADESAPIVWRR